MTMNEICNHEYASMLVRRKFGYNQYDDHVWRWLNYHLKVWGDAHPYQLITK